MRVMPGACGRRARLHAADGSPMPTKQTSLLLTQRAAATVISSSGEYLTSGHPYGAPRECLGIRAHHVLIDPGSKTVAFAGDGVPRQVERVISLVVAVGVRGKRASRHDRDRTDGPVREHARIRRDAVERLDDFLDRDDRSRGSQYGFLLHA